MCTQCTEQTDIRKGTQYNILELFSTLCCFLIAVSAESSPDGYFVVKNAAKSPCDGVYNIGLYKDDALLVVQPDVQPGTEVQFQLHNSLSFAVVKERIGKIFDPINVIGSPTTFDLDKFPCGLVVNLSQDPASGEYVFTGTSGQ